MSRPLRIEYPGAWYHVMNRGRRSESIFSDKHDYLMFIDLLIEASEMYNVNVAAYICDRIKTTLIYIESNIATISNDVGLCFRLGQMSNGSRVFRFSIKHFREISFFKMHFAKS